MEVVGEEEFLEIEVCAMIEVGSEEVEVFYFLGHLDIAGLQVGLEGNDFFLELPKFLQVLQEIFVLAVLETSIGEEGSKALLLDLNISGEHLDEIHHAFLPADYMFGVGEADMITEAVKN